MAGFRIPTVIAFEIFQFLIILGLILIDHGHFQYNGISLGLMVFAVAIIMRDKVILNSKSTMSIHISFSERGTLVSFTSKDETMQNAKRPKQIARLT